MCIYKKVLSTVDTVRTLNITLIIIIIITIIIVVVVVVVVTWVSLVTGLFFPVLLLNQRDPQRSRFKLHTAVLSVLCVMFQVQLSFVVNLSNVFLVQISNFSLTLYRAVLWGIKFLAFL